MQEWLQLLALAAPSAALLAVTGRQPEASAADALPAEEYRLLFEQMHEAVFISTPDGRLLDCNYAMVNMLGYSSREELMAIPISAHYASPESRPRIVAEFAQRGYVRSLEVSLRRKDGSQLNVLETGFATRDTDGAVIRYQGLLLDVTEKKRTEAELRRRNRELLAMNEIANAVHGSFDLDEILELTLRHLVDLFVVESGGIYVFDETRMLLSRRAGFGHRSRLGLDAPDISIPPEFLEYMRRTRTELITEEHLPQLPQFVSEFVRAEELTSWMWIVLWRQDRVVGVVGISSRSPRLFTSSDQDLLMAIARQLAVTIERVQLYQETRRAYDQLRLAQEQLLQSEKMSAIGQMISGVAHELNNPLTAILGYSQLLESEPMEDRARDFVEKIFKQARRTQKIVQNLLSFARQRKPQKQSTDVVSVLEDTLALRDYDLRLNDIAVVKVFDPDLPHVIADTHQLEQVFLNVLNNSVDAIMENRGPGLLRVRAFEQDGHVCVEFHDSGHGMADPARVFDPFYTTKEVGKGTGLGLSICYGIVKEHGGEITANNSVEGGAIFRVALPPSPAAERGRQPRSATRPHARISGRLLIVDDEETLIELEQEILTAAGAQVSAARSAQQAVEQLTLNDFDLVVIDGKMPGGSSGRDLYGWISEHKPALIPYIVLTNSDVNDLEMRSFIASSGVQCILKPFEPADLLAVVRRLLARERGTAQTSAASA